MLKKDNLKIGKYHLLERINNFQPINNFFLVVFFYIELNNVKIDIDNAVCNDALNFINSYGKIKEQI